MEDTNNSNRKVGFRDLNNDKMIVEGWKQIKC